jgi:CobQ-like glutamine amidotransferase family enzyme
MHELTIAHLYPDLMNLYGDRGNLICLQKRLSWRGYPCRIQEISLGDDLPLDQLDMLFMGGGSDREQGLVYRDLARRADTLFQHIDNGLPVLFICGAYQLLGRSYIAADGENMEGLGLFPFHTRGASDRLIGNILLESTLEEKTVSVVGFENHGGRTFFDDPTLKPFGIVQRGYGNNGQDHTEGLHYKNLIGTYLHGPLLPKNPSAADFFIGAILKRRGLDTPAALDDHIENYAHQQVKQKILKNSR